MSFPDAWSYFLGEKMNSNNEQFRTIIFYNFRRELSHALFIQQLAKFFLPFVFCFWANPSEVILFRWFVKLIVERNSLLDKDLSEIVVRPENNNVVRQLLAEDRYTAFITFGFSIFMFLSHSKWISKQSQGRDLSLSVFHFMTSIIFCDFF